MTAPTRPALRYLGGKWRLAPWIIQHFPKRHRVYVEPFGGAASVLLRKPRSQGECYNDLSGDVVELFRVLRDPAQAEALRRAVDLTPFARAEYDLAFEVANDPVERSRRLLVRSYMGHGSSSALSHRSTGFRASLVNRDGALPANDWATLPPGLEQIHRRLAGVVIEHRPAQQVMGRYDGADALFYVDPPYMPETRSPERRGGALSNAYSHELSEGDHAELLAFLRGLEGSVVLSGYPSRLYDLALADWRRIEKATHADGARPRTEVLWLNPRASSLLEAA